MPKRKSQLYNYLWVVNKVVSSKISAQFTFNFDSYSILIQKTIFNVFGWYNIGFVWLVYFIYLFIKIVFTGWKLQFTKLILMFVRIKTKRLIYLFPFFSFFCSIIEAKMGLFKAVVFVCTIN